MVRNLGFSPSETDFESWRDHTFLDMHLCWLCMYLCMYIYIYYNYTWLYIDIYMYQWVTALKEPHLESINPYKFRSLNFRLQTVKPLWACGTGDFFPMNNWERAFAVHEPRDLGGTVGGAACQQQTCWHSEHDTFSNTFDLGWYPFQCWWLLYIFITTLQLVNTCNWCCCPEEALDFLVFHCRWLWWSSEPPFSVPHLSCGKCGKWEWWIRWLPF